VVVGLLGMTRYSCVRLVLTVNLKVDVIWLVKEVCLLSSTDGVLNNWDGSLRWG
jgi:hypothetical protein